MEGCEITITSLSDSPIDLAPVSSAERIQALDVVRGFALIGIFLMNVEFFNRALDEVDQGLPTTLTGANWLAGWLIYNFVQGKFWTMFSLLFGMGFAVMLTRAERADRNFIRPYLRRIAALAVFGALHGIFIWGGDILFSYAIGALGLLVLLYGNWKFIAGAWVLLLVLGFIPMFEWAEQIAAGLAILGIAALFLRGEWQAKILGRRVALFSTPSLVRTRRVGVAMYLFPLLLMAAFGAVQYFSPPDPPEPVATATESKADQGQRAQGHAQDIARERRILAKGSYAEAVELRAGEFAKNVPAEAIFATLIIGMFLLGVWFVRSGVMEHTAAHLPLFRKLALYGLPFGIGLGLFASSIATSRTPGLENDPFQMTVALMAIGNLPACLGYVSLIVLMLHSQTALAKISLLAPLGRMALTNYLMQSVIGTLYFYGYGLGHWGMGRAWQVLFVAVVISFQLALSHWWLARFRYGPMEWLWRAITYWRAPPMRRERDWVDATG